MRRNQRGSRPRAKLLVGARSLGVPGASRLPTPALAAVIDAVRSRQAAAPTARLDRAELSFHRAGRVRTLALRNRSPRSLRVQLEVLDDHSGAFSVPAKARIARVRPGAALRVPVTFRPGADGVLMTRARRYRGAVRLWDANARRVIGLVALGGLGPGRVPRERLRCLYAPAPDPAAPVGNSPPAVSLRIRPEIGWAGEPLHVQWSVTGADAIWEGVFHPGEEVLPAGTFTDWGGGTGPADVSFRSYDSAFGRTTMVEIVGRNAEGETAARVTAYAKVPVGYYAASTPGGGVAESELALVRSYLVDIDRRLRGGCIRDNAALDDFGDPYLRGALTDDILAAMRGVLVLTGPEKLPTTHRMSRLCEDGVYGVTPSDRSLVGICRAIGADALTLLHELYHYAAASDNGSEEKAAAVSLGCF